MPLPVHTLHLLRRFWLVHKHPVLIFPNRKRGLKNAHLTASPLERGGVQSSMKKVVNELHFNENISCHSLRHSYATHLLEAGVDILELPKIFGHVSILTTFTLRTQLRQITWYYQRIIYSFFFKCAWETIKTFAYNDKKLSGRAGAIAVMHTHSR